MATIQGSISKLVGNSLAMFDTLGYISTNIANFNTNAYKAQRELPLLNENGIVYFCGSYFKYGFHEDALNSAIDLCKKLSTETTVEK